MRRSIADPVVALDPGSGPLYQQIYDGYRAAILDGRLRAGNRIPSTRALAEKLGISRLPVLNAFEQLSHEGYLEGRVGSGTYVAASVLEKERAAPRRASRHRRLQGLDRPLPFDLSRASGLGPRQAIACAGMCEDGR